MLSINSSGQGPTPGCASGGGWQPQGTQNSASQSASSGASDGPLLQQQQQQQLHQQKQQQEQQARLRALLEQVHHQQPQQPPQQQQLGAPAPTSTPQAVVDRMGRRVLSFMAVPMAGGVAALGAFWYLKIIAKVEYPLWLAYLGSSLLFGGGLLGITYGILSTSWDPRREGSALGWTELQANVALLLDKDKNKQQ